MSLSRRLIAVVGSIAIAGGFTHVVAQREQVIGMQPLTLFDRHGHVSAHVGDPGLYSQPAFSPDGTRLAVVKVDPDTQNADIWVISVSTGASLRITSDPGADGEPTWSPDGKQLAFISRRQGAWRIYRASSSVPGTEELLYQHKGFGGLSNLWWSQDGGFLSFADFINISGALYVFPLDGTREPHEAMRPALFNARIAPNGQFIGYPFNASGRIEMFIRRFDPFGIEVTASPSSGARQISSNGAIGMLHWRQDGREAYYLTPARGVMAVDVNTSPSIRIRPPRLLFPPPSTRAAVRLAAVSPTGDRFIFNMPASPVLRQLTITDRNGHALAKIGKPDTYAQPTLSPDGTKIATIHTDPETGHQDIWTLDVSHGVRYALTSDPAADSAPVWSPDGREVAFVSTHSDVTAIVKKFWNGTGPAEVLYEHTPGTPSVVLTDWSADRRLLTFFAGETLYVLPLDGSRKPIDVERTEFSSIGGRFSPDGRLLAYLSDRSGRYEIYVRPLIGVGGQLLVEATSRQLSSEGAVGMISWPQDASAIEYLAAAGSLMAVDVANHAGGQPVAPRRLFQLPRQSFGGPYAALDNPVQAKITSADGQRLVFALPIERTP